MIKKQIWKKVAALVTTLGIAVSLFGGEASAKSNLAFTGNDAVFRLARIAEDDGLSSLEGTKHWVKIFQSYNGNEKKVIFDKTSLASNTSAIAVTFEISDYDLTKAYEISWGYNLTGDDGTKVSWDTQKSGVSIDGNGTYVAIFDVEKALGTTVSPDGIGSLEMPVQLADDEKTAKTKQICIAVTGAVCYTKGETVDVTAGKVSEDTTKDTTEVPVVTQPASKKKIGTLKITKAKAGSRQLTGKTIKNGEVTVKYASKNYTVKADKKGDFTVKLKKKLVKGEKLKITVKKSGYSKKVKTFIIK